MNHSGSPLKYDGFEKIYINKFGMIVEKHYSLIFQDPSILFYNKEQSLLVDSCLGIMHTFENYCRWGLC